MLQTNKSTPSQAHCTFSVAKCNTMSSKLVALAALCLVAHAACINGCIHEYGSAEGQGGVHFTYAYNGLDWYEEYETCKGSRQSPLLLPAHGANGANLPSADAKSSFKYSTVNKPTLLNNGHTVQVTLPENFTSDVTIPIKGDKHSAKITSIITSSGAVTGRVKATPAQFHFHSHSEHIISGAEYALELHIVHFIKQDQLPACPEKGCIAVVGIMIGLTDDDTAVNPELRKLIKEMPYYEGEQKVLSTSVDVNGLLPKNQTYMTYEGSLTAPPCTEGLLWHVMLNPIKITPALLTHYLESVGDSNCPSPNTEGAVTEKAFQYTKEGPPADTKTKCQKLANGHNWRVVQPRNKRPIALAVN